MRLDKLLAHSGFGTRKEVKDFIKKGNVTVNGEIAKKDKMQVDPQTDEVCVNGEVITYEELNSSKGGNVDLTLFTGIEEQNLWPETVTITRDIWPLQIKNKK